MPDNSEDTAKSLANIEISDLAGLSKPLAKLIDNVGGAIGAVYEPTHVRRKAKADADAATTLAKSDIKISALQQRAEHRRLNVETRRQENIESIVRESAQDLDKKNEADVSDEPVDQDWVNDFFDICKDVGNAEMQAAWGRILSGEIAQPGQFSRAALLTLRNLKPHHAQLFESLCRFAWHFPSLDLQTLPLVFNMKAGACAELNLRYTNFQTLDDVGLISLNSLGNMRMNNQAKVTSFYGGKEHQFTSTSVAWNDFPLGHVAFTEVGRELFSITHSKVHPGHRKEVIDFLATKGWELQPASS